MCIKKKIKQNIALAGVTQWIEQQPANCEVASSLLGQGTGLGVWARSPVRGVREAADPGFSCTSMMFLSLSPSIPLFLKVNKIFKKNQIW